MLFSSIADDQAQTDRFFGVLTGSEPLRDYMNPRNLRKIVGVRGMTKMVLGKVRGQRSDRDQRPRSAVARPRVRTPAGPR